MVTSQQPLSQEEFDDIYSKVPRLTVEIIVEDARKNIYLTRRAIEPCKGQWHLPGGTVRFGEPMVVAVKRIAERELSIKVTHMINVGYIEYPSHYKHGLDSPVGTVFKIDKYEGVLLTNPEASESAWFKKVPDNMHADQDTFLRNNGFLK